MLNSGRVFAGDKGIRELRERNSAPGQEAPALRSSCAARRGTSGTGISRFSGGPFLRASRGAKNCFTLLPRLWL